METKKVILKGGKDEALKRRHPWVFSGAVQRTEGDPQNGEIVHVYSSKQQPLATGFYADGSIAIRIFDFEAVDANQQYWNEKISKAVAFRNSVMDYSNTNVYRLFNAEGDGVPGLIIDFYNGTAVIQCHTPGTYKIRKQIAEALKENLGGKLKAIYDKSSEALGNKGIQNQFMYQADGYNAETVLENGLQFSVDFESGQKTGFFIDQRNNRKLLGEFAKGKKVLNAFCYTGGFSVYALQGGAELVHSVDSSAKAIELADKNVALNYTGNKHQSFTSDVFDFLKRDEAKYDVMVLDPPAFAKHFSARHNALVAYKRLNYEAFKKIEKGGIVFTFSCSGVVTRELFESAVMAGAIEAGRNVRIIERLGQPLCHPVSIFHPEGEYLKGLVLHVE